MRSHSPGSPAGLAPSINQSITGWTSSTPRCGVMRPSYIGGTACFLASEHAPDLPRHVRLAERLHQQVDAGIEPTVVDDGVASVAGGEEHLEIGASSMRFVGELSAVDAVR